MQTIFFSHAKGFPARTYDYFLRKLHPFAVDYVPVLGDHTPAPLRHWRSLTHELINAIESRHSAPVIGLGHSLGAVLTLWAAASRPVLFSRVILMDPPLFVPTKRWLLAGITALGLAPWLNPVAQKARNRRQHFTSLAEAEAYWRPKPLFRDFHPQCFQDYVAHALQPDQDGFSLRFPAEWGWFSPPFPRRRGIPLFSLRPPPHRPPAAGSQPFCTFDRRQSPTPGRPGMAEKTFSIDDFCPGKGRAHVSTRTARSHRRDDPSSPRGRPLCA